MKCFLFNPFLPIRIVRIVLVFRYGCAAHFAIAITPMSAFTISIDASVSGKGVIFFGDTLAGANRNW